MKRKVIIIGGGISGMTAGIYLQKAGFDTVILEKNAVPGGECTGWKREGFVIDNCFHWLTGTKEGSDLNELWKEIGMLGGDVDIYHKDEFYSYTSDGKTVTFWRDLERTKAELLELAPEDRENIEAFIENVRKVESMTVPVEKPFDKMGLKDYVKMGASMKDIPAVQKAYKGMSIDDLANTFKNPVIRRALCLMIPPKSPAFSFIASYATITAGNGDIPLGGSLAASLRIASKYESLGGKLVKNAPVKEILIEGDIAKGAVLENGETIEGDYVIAATDAGHIFTKLLPESYMPKSLGREFKSGNYSVFSGFHAAFAVDGEHRFGQESEFFDAEEMMVAGTKVNIFGIKCYDYDRSFAPEGKSVIQVQIVQSENDYEYWRSLRDSSPEEYNKKKHELADEIRERIEKSFPEVAGKLRLLDTWTPATYQRYCNAYNGAYMAFVADKNVKSVRTKGTVKRLKNVFLAGQWLMGQGGLPVAAAMGRFAAWRIADKEKVSL
ncbi:MAG: NAD(P)/FAD-dependent oxidoreductase [Lachnospiraceae bacterium]|nr:NAD(P)/FAD-dependent oxidoreductase [Lachnospiraceae bacterium]